MKTFGEAQQELIDHFKQKLVEASEQVLSKFYTDVTIHAESDSHINFYGRLRDEMKEEMISEITTSYSHYSWAHGIRMELLKNHKDVLSNKIIDDLQDKIEHLNSVIEQMYRSRL